MWGEIFGLALLTQLNPLLLAFILLVISRPRPVQNLFAFWVGALIVNALIWLGTLMALHLIPSFESVAKDLATPAPGSSVHPLRLGMGVFCLLVAALITARLLMRQRASQPAAAGAGGGTSTLVLESDASTANSRPVGRVRGAVTNVRSAIRRLVSRAHDTWESGAVWMSLVFGLAYIPPSPLVLLITTIVVASGASIGTQVIAILAFIFTMLAIFVIALLSYVVAPARTQAVLEPLHNWARDHRMQVLLVVFTVVGIWQVATGIGII